MVITIKNKGGVERVCKFHSWYGGAKGAGKSLVMLDLGGIGGIGTFSLSHGYGSGRLKEWRIPEDDLPELRAWAEAEHKRKIAKTPRSTGRKRQPKTVKTDPRQEGLFEND